jgi:hypothetical protein
MGRTSGLGEEQLQLDCRLVGDGHDDRGGRSLDAVGGQVDVERADDDDRVVDELRLERQRDLRRDTVDGEVTGRLDRRSSRPC